MFKKKEKRLVGDGCFIIIRETERYIEFLSNSTKQCWIICINQDRTDTVGSVRRNRLLNLLFLLGDATCINGIG